jgi:hypothetical protein
MLTRGFMAKNLTDRAKKPRKSIRNCINHTHPYTTSPPPMVGVHQIP